jgi:hypothetical protein
MARQFEGQKLCLRSLKHRPAGQAHQIPAAVLPLIQPAQESLRWREQKLPK